MTHAPDDPAAARAQIRVLTALADLPVSVARAVLAAVAEALDPPRTPAPRRRRERQGCPSEAAYQRHKRNGEQCSTCREHIRQIRRTERAQAAARRKRTRS